MSPGKIMVCCQHQILQRNGCKGHVPIKDHLLPHSQQFTRLYTEHIHSNYDHMGATRKVHLGISSRVATIGSCFWKSNLTKLVKSIRHKCIHCKADNQRFEMQSMGKFLVERLKGEVNKRTTGLFSLPSSSSRAYARLFNRRVLFALRWFMSLRGYPSKIYSDPGTQLTRNYNHYWKN